MATVTSRAKVAVSGSRYALFNKKNLEFKTDKIDAFHTVTSTKAAHGVLNGIDPYELNPQSRFGEAFYISEIPDTTLAELSHHGSVGIETIRFEFYNRAAKILDLTNPKIARLWR